jgi:hypothetical protein
MSETQNVEPETPAAAAPAPTASPTTATKPAPLWKRLLGKS